MILVTQMGQMTLNYQKFFFYSIQILFSTFLKAQPPTLGINYTSETLSLSEREANWTAILFFSSFASVNLSLRSDINCAFDSTSDLKLSSWGCGKDEAPPTDEAMESSNDCKKNSH